MTRAEWGALLLAGCLYLPFAFCGLGSDSDSERIIVKTLTALVERGEYVPSRYPGNPLHELATSGLYLLGGSAFANLGSVATALVALASLLAICRYFQLPRRAFVALLVALNPVFWIAATSSVDYVWALAGMLAGFALSLRGRFGWAGACFGLALAARLSSALGCAVWGVAFLATRPQQRAGVLAAGAIATAVAVVAYLPVYLHAGHSFAFLTYYMGDFGWSGRLGRFAYRNVYFWGFQTVVGLLVLSWWRRGELRAALSRLDPLLLAWCLGNVVAYEALYLRIPLEAGYLLPVLPPVAILCGSWLAARPSAWIGLLLLELSAALITPNFVRPDVPHAATRAEVGFWLEPGALIQDTQARLRIAREGFVHVESGAVR